MVVVCVMGKALGFFIKQQYQYAGKTLNALKNPQREDTMLLATQW
jgi:hypothetical protein